MRKIINNIIRIVTVTISVAVTSCTNEIENTNIPQNDPNLVEITLKACAESDNSKADIDIEDYPAIRWNKGDRISVIGANSGSNRVLTAEETGLKSVLKGFVQKNDDRFYAVYPYDETISLSEDSDQATLLNVTIPTQQYAKAGSFDPQAFKAFAEFGLEDENITFKTACALLKFRLYNAAKVKSVRIDAHQTHENVILSGTTSMKIDANGVPTIGNEGIWTKGAAYVELIEAEGGHQFSPTTDYYIVINADLCQGGITATVTYDNGESFSKSTYKQIFPESSARNCIMNLGILNSNGNEFDEVLNEVVDFSYAGYMHGEVAPPDVNTLGYTVYDVTRYGAIPNDGKSDRNAFLETLNIALGTPTIDNNGWITYPHKPQANAIIYFPAGEYILHTSADDDKANSRSQSIIIRAGNFVIKGAGRDKTTLVMQDPMLPKNISELYSSPDMIQLKHNSGMNTLTTVSGSTAAKGSFSVSVSNTSELTAGDWVCLYIKNDSEKFVKEELEPYTVPTEWDIAQSGNGIKVYDFHQIKTINGNQLTFHEPLMHEVNPNDDWLLNNYPHYENVGVEDLTFKGNAAADFTHHLDWNHDGGYKPLSMNRLTNSWIRRVNFVSVSEACTILNSANVSAYDIVMSGNRGHSAVRAQVSSRTLIAATKDITSDNAGNYHGVGVSKECMGTVLWRNTWGNDSCFESHANQPRATLIDCCKGGWIKGRMGGSYNEAPHHLADLTIWNFYATAGSGNFTWWDAYSWNFLPPVIVGFRSRYEITFPEDQVRYDLMHGDIPHIESLYEQQLINRMGYVPAWLNELKY